MAVEGGPQDPPRPSTSPRFFWFSPEGPIGFRLFPGSHLVKIPPQGPLAASEMRFVFLEDETPSITDHSDSIIWTGTISGVNEDDTNFYSYTFYHNQYIYVKDKKRKWVGYAGAGAGGRQPKVETQQGRGCNC